MPSFKTLLDAGSAASALKEDITLIRALRDMASNWADLSTHLDDISSVEALLDRLASDVDSAALKKAFEKIGADDLRATLSRLLGKVVDLENGLPDKYRLLLRKLSDFDELATGAKDAGLAPWTILDADKDIPVGGKYRLGLQAGSRLELEAGDTWRFSGDAMPHPLLRLSAGAGLGADAGAAIPFHAGSLKASASASAGLGLDYYFNARASDALFVAAVAERLTQLPDPFDFSSVWDAFATTDLAGVIYRFDGAASLAVDVGLADTFSLGAGVLGSLGATVGVNVSMSGAYSLSLRAGPAADAGGRQLIATLSRRKLSSGSFSAGVGLEVDIASLVRELHKILQKAVGAWDEILEEVRPFLSPGDWLQNKAASLVEEVAAKAIGDDKLREAIVRDLGGAAGVDTTDKSALAAWAAKELTTAIERSGVLAKPEAAVETAIAALAGRLPAFAQQDVKQTLSALLAQLTQKVDEGFKGKIEKLVGPDGAAMKKLGQALKKAGVEAKDKVNSLNAAVAGVRQLVERYDSLFRKLLTETEDAVQRKVSARLQIEEARTKDVTYQFAGTLLARSDSARRVFEALTRGRLSDLASLLDGSATAADFSLDRERSSIRRYSKSESKLGYELVLLNFRLTGSDLLVAEASALVDGDGDVQIDARSQLTRAFSGPTEGREVSFVDVYKLLLAREQQGAGPSVRRFLEMGVSIVHKDESLKRGEMEKFITSLERVRLLPAGAAERAVLQFDQWTQAGANSRLIADLAAKLWLTDEAPVALLRLQDRRHDQLTKDASLSIIQTGRLALHESGALSLSDLKEAAEVVLDAAREGPMEIDELILRFPKLPPNLQDGFFGPTASRAKERVEFFSREQEMLNNLVEMINIMGRVYEAKPPGTAGAGIKTWDQDDYRKAQRKIAASTRAWLGLNQKFFFWARAEVHPRTVALLCAVADLAGVERSSALTLVMTNRPEGRPPETVVLA